MIVIKNGMQVIVPQQFGYAPRVAIVKELYTNSSGFKMALVKYIHGSDMDSVLVSSLQINKTVEVKKMNEYQQKLIFTLAETFNKIAEECEKDDDFHNIMIDNNDLFSLSLDEFAAEWHALAEGSRIKNTLIKSISFYHLGSTNNRLNVYKDPNGRFVAEVLTDGHLFKTQMQWGGSEMFKPYYTIAGMLKAVNKAGYPIFRDQLGGL